MGKGLTRARIVETALLVVDEGGLKALSMRTLAKRLDVEAMSLYGHLNNKADLLDALYDHLIGRVVFPEDGDWQCRVTQVATEFRDLLFAHPAVVPLLATRPGTTPQALVLLERGVGLFEDEGWSPEPAVIAFQTVFSFVLGHAVFHTAGGELRGDDAWTQHEFAQGLEMLVCGLATRAPSPHTTGDNS